MIFQWLIYQRPTTINSTFFLILNILIWANSQHTKSTPEQSNSCYVDQDRDVFHSILLNQHKANSFCLGAPILTNPPILKGLFETKSTHKFPLTHLPPLNVFHR